jgi:exodeoxyribonuclease V beta subunit
MHNYRYEKDFGGIFYIFLRGVDPDHGPEYGIYFDRPEFGFIESLAGTLIPGYPDDRSDQPVK